MLQSLEIFFVELKCAQKMIFKELLFKIIINYGIFKL